ncbi:hypothetical protein PHYBLDRAFT_142204 [Phycomyces blakesleeanus NRRL 1555(-)]|uniref:Thioesterase domain-containing protein n=2 Tax=Phycomyces blakesleeanus TaxID=4837 RepID=A0A167NVD4_PHYB8|nr:hypothetical protein PHYBLDRAFT_142204 [Phycomyces blakesleeanus NRRL 1555(-)]OAD76689.1 hypothetical protein PHYBLDRAFT_142204 [Phycomyces blakesleeanus NRRL 1555(-)]|eukprot:XP_018294729.1 hypothetical protein PHYBLDRAFT_142204 [Phycomyces blakesleeanus NRRL 1555(-)]
MSYKLYADEEYSDTRSVLAYLTDPKLAHWSKSIIDNIDWFCIKPNTFMCQFNPDRDNCQSFLTEHGGHVGSLMDICSSIAVTTATDGRAWDRHGMTTHLSTQFYKPLVINTPVVMTSKIITISETSAIVETRIYNLDDPDSQYAFGIHKHVYIRNPKL